jgi:methylmalonyl-CoA/ethylmalonyl-CoA epimerase
MFTIDHLGIAVKSLAAAKGIYEKLGLSVSAEETVEGEQVRCVMVPVGETRLELLEPTSESSVIAKFIAKRGEGLHHVSLRVPDLGAAVVRLKKDGVRLVSKLARGDIDMFLCILPVRVGFCWSWWRDSGEKQVPRLGATCVAQASLGMTTRFRRG